MFGKFIEKITIQGDIKRERQTFFEISLMNMNISFSLIKLLFSISFFFQEISITDRSQGR